MKTVLKTSALALALAMTASACSGESSANGGQANGPVVADTSQNWVETVEKTEEGGFRMGNPDAAIRIVEYGSLTCPHCADFAEQSFNPLVENYISQGTVSFEMRNFVRDPLDLAAALLARCNGAAPFFQLNERLFANQAAMITQVQGAGEARLQQIAQSSDPVLGYAEAAGLIPLVGGMGISETQARQCLADQDLVGELETLRNTALSEYNLSGTPTFLINGQVASGVVTWPQLEARIQEMVQ
ncbi:DsbA family protein [Parasphingopyxis marina]|nr:thioredoxin domain-containing protein [Parasphingopyxis marina]